MRAGGSESSRSACRWVGRPITSGAPPQLAMLVTDLDPREVERVQHQLDLAAHQRGVDLVLVAVQRHRRRYALLAP